MSKELEDLKQVALERRKKHKQTRMVSEAILKAKEMDLKGRPSYFINRWKP